MQTLHALQNPPYIFLKNAAVVQTSFSELLTVAEDNFAWAINAYMPKISMQI